MLVVGILGSVIGLVVLVIGRNLHWALRCVPAVLIIAGTAMVVWSDRQTLDRDKHDASEQREQLCKRAAFQLKLLQDRVTHSPGWWPERAALYVWTDGAAPLLDPILAVCIKRPDPCEAYLHYAALLADPATVESTHRKELVAAIGVIVDAIETKSTCPAPPARSAGSAAR